MSVRYSTMVGYGILLPTSEQPDHWYDPECDALELLEVLGLESISVGLCGDFMTDDGMYVLFAADNAFWQTGDMNYEIEPIEFNIEDISEQSTAELNVLAKAFGKPIGWKVIPTVG